MVSDGDCRKWIVFHIITYDFSSILSCLTSLCRDFTGRSFYLIPVIVGQFTVIFLRFASNFFYFVFSFPKYDVLPNGYDSEHLTSFISLA
ncbi:hypothetical protein SM14VA4_48780 (plasmid) [Serratia marcescens]|nr:hypothetical protein SM14VA4_48780 [Serratia marcescens]